MTSSSSTRRTISAFVRSQRDASMSTIFNDSDNIERHMQEDGHKIWGWVIYRSDYSSDEDWRKFLDLLRVGIEKNLSRHGGLDMLSSLNYHIFEDQDLFDGVEAAMIREHFRSWTATASEQEQGVDAGWSQRYQFCIQVDADALRSVMEAPLPGQRGRRDKSGWVKLIWKDWEPKADDRMERPEDQPVEGIALHDVGWCRADLQAVMPFLYSVIRSQSDWYREYRRPPKIIH